MKNLLLTLFRFTNKCFLILMPGFLCLFMGCVNSSGEQKTSITKTQEAIKTFMQDYRSAWKKGIQQQFFKSLVPIQFCIYPDKPPNHLWVKKRFVSFGFLTPKKAIQFQLMTLKTNKLALQMHQLITKEYQNSHGIRQIKEWEETQYFQSQNLQPF